MSPATSRRRASATSLAFHYVSAGLLVVQGFLLVPLYLRFTPVAVYGGWLALGNIIGWIELLDPGLGALVQQRIAYYDGKKQRDKIPGALLAGLIWSGALSIAPLLAWPLADIAAHVVQASGPEAAALAKAFRIGLLAMCVMMTANLLSAASAGLQLAFSSGAATTVATVAGILATILLLYSGHGIASIPSGLLFRAVLNALLNLAILLRWLRHEKILAWPRITRPELFSVGQFSVYTFGWKMSGVLLGRIDSALCAVFVSPTAAVTYTLTARALDPVRMLAERIPAAAAPSLSHLAGSGEVHRNADTVRQILRLVTVSIAAGVAGVVSLNEPFMRLWVGKDIFGGQWLTTLQAGAVGLAVLATSRGQTTFALGKIRSSVRILVVEGLVKAPLQVGSILVAGPIGLPVAAAAATLLVSGRHLPRLAAEVLSASGAEEARSWWRSVLVVATFAALGLLIHFGVPWEWITSWPRFALAVGLVGAGAAVAALVTDIRLIPELLRNRRSALAWRG